MSSAGLGRLGLEGPANSQINGKKLIGSSVGFMNEEIDEICVLQN